MVFIYYIHDHNILIYFTININCTALLCFPYIPLYFLELLCITLHFNALHKTALNDNVLYCTALIVALMHCILPPRPVPHGKILCTSFLITMKYTLCLWLWLCVHCIVLHCTALHCTALNCFAMHYTALYCTALHFIVLDWTALN